MPEIDYKQEHFRLLYETEGFKIHLCKLLNLDYLTVSYMDIYHAIALLDIGAELEKARIKRFLDVALNNNKVIFGVDDET